MVSEPAPKTVPLTVTMPEPVPAKSVLFANPTPTLSSTLPAPFWLKLGSARFCPVVNTRLLPKSVTGVLPKLSWLSRKPLFAAEPRSLVATSAPGWVPKLTK